MTTEEIQEVLLHATVYCGVPLASEAFRAAHDVLIAQKVAQQDDVKD